MAEYISVKRVNADVVGESGSVGTADGLRSANAGDYLVHYEGRGTVLVSKDEFEREFQPVENADDKGPVFSPAGHTVEQVVEYLKLNPGEVDRVKKLEEKGGKRKGILEYAVD